jgi:Flp pilus assembly protein TadD
MQADRTDRLRDALTSLHEGRFTAVEATCASLLATGADLDAALLLGLALGGQGRMEQANRTLDEVARARPDQAHPCRDLAELLAQHGRMEEAATQYQAWLARRPDDAAAHHALGLLLAELGRVDEAIRHFRRTVQLDPAPAMGWSNLGVMLKIERRFDEAVAAHDQAVASAPADPQIRINRAVALLHARRMTEAWGDYEWRLRQPGHTQLPDARLLPDVESVDLAGRTVLVTHEEGFGDTLQ